MDVEDHYVYMTAHTIEDAILGRFTSGPFIKEQLKYIDSNDGQLFRIAKVPIEGTPLGMLDRNLDSWISVAFIQNGKYARYTIDSSSHLVDGSNIVAAINNESEEHHIIMVTNDLYSMLTKREGDGVSGPYECVVDAMAAIEVMADPVLFMVRYNPRSVRNVFYLLGTYIAAGSGWRLYDSPILMTNKD